MATIEVSALTKRYGAVTALDGLSFGLDQGVVGLMGANGAGKSTLIKILLGLLAPTSGAARVLGLDATTEGLRARERIGYMPEHDCLPSDVTAANFVAHMAQLSGLPSREAHGRAADTLRYVGLDEERYRPIGGYSTGMKQRVKFAQALVHDPEILFLDEPTNGLDPSGREQMLNLIKRTGEGTGLCIVMSTHIMGDVEQICDQIVMLDGGRMIHAGPLAGFSATAPYITVTVAPGEGARLAQALAGHGLRARADGDSAVVDFTDERAFDLIRDTVADLGLPLLRMGRRRSSLADLFQSSEFAPPSAAPVDGIAAPEDDAARARGKARVEENAR